MKKLNLLLITAAMAASIASAPAFAKHGFDGDGPNNGHGHRREMMESRDNDRNHNRDRERHEYEERHESREEFHRFDDQRRADIRRYLDEDFRRRCPHGLAKKHNGCRAPGHAKKTYVIGGYLPTRHWAPPETLIVRMGPPPPGAYYAMVDNDVVLVSEATKKIIDAVALLSAVGR